MRDVIVIGAGVIGATVSKVLASRGMDVLTLDDRRPFSGTGPSGGHLRSSWFGEMPETLWRPSLQTLDQAWGLLSESFRVGPVKETVYRVDTDVVLAAPFTRAKALGVSLLNNYPLVEYRVFAGAPKEVVCERCRWLLVATGTWANELVKGVDTTAKQGVSFRVKQVLQENVIIPWAPYKQVVAHQQTGSTVWVGDGTAILTKNWTDAKTAQVRERCLRVAELTGDVLEERQGWRPYSSHEPMLPCLLRQLGPRAWVATGAGKRGTIAAGWVANTLVSSIEQSVRSPHR